MPDSSMYYADARQRGLKDLRQHRNETLPVLEDLVSEELMRNCVRVGLADVPTELIVGTKTAARANVFAPNYMPIAEDNTEFAGKWRLLCDAHLSEGIRDSVELFEYKNRYYAGEGNKRVSVLKYFGAPSIQGEVKRIPVPEGADPLYDAWKAFNKVSGQMLLEFSRPEYYQTLYRLLSKKPGVVWDVDDRRTFSACFNYFRTAYEAGNPHPDRVKTSDALISYLSIYGYERLTSRTSTEILKSVARIRDELSLDPQAVELKAEPPEAKKSLLSRLNPFAGPRTLKAAFVHDKTPEDSGWTLSHEMGRLRLKKLMGDSVVTTAYMNAVEEGAEETIRRAVADGNTVIFTTSPLLMEEAQRVAADFPNVHIFNCSINKASRLVTPYHARMYEVRFIAGLIAGVMTRKNIIGYVADYPIYGTPAAINAFALGVRSVNPRARVLVEWAGVLGEDGAPAALIERGADILSCRDKVPLCAKTPRGLVAVHNDDIQLLAMPVWNWGVMYRQILDGLQNGGILEEERRVPLPVNYYWGMNSGAVDILLHPSVPQSLRQLCELLRHTFMNSGYNPFRGDLFTQEGQQLCTATEENGLSLDRISHMMQLLDWIEGEMPAYEDLNEKARLAVDSMGERSLATGEGGA